MNGTIRLITGVSQGEASDLLTAFADDLGRQTSGVVLFDGQRVLDSLQSLPEQPVVLLNADRANVMDLLARFPLSAAIEKYALFAWWRKRGKSDGAFWLHGSVDVTRHLGAEVQRCGLYSTADHCAFGSPSYRGLPELLARYLEAAKK